MRRTCEICGKELRDGMTDDYGTFYCCQEHFAEYMNREYGLGNWRDVEDDGCNGYYVARIDGGEWFGTGIYWTEWEEDD